MKKIFFVLFIYFPILVFSQDTIIKNSAYIYKKNGYWSLNGEKLNGEKLKKELYKVPAAIPFYKKAQTNKIICYTLFFTMASFALLGRQNTTTYPYKQHTGFKIAGIISGVGVFYFLSKYSKNIKKAVRLYNE